jgi:hypothetical protein
MPVQHSAFGGWGRNDKNGEEGEGGLTGCNPNPYTCCGAQSVADLIAVPSTTVGGKEGVRLAGRRALVYHDDVRVDPACRRDTWQEAN